MELKIQYGEGPGRFLRQSGVLFSLFVFQPRQSALQAVSPWYAVREIKKIPRRDDGVSECDVMAPSTLEPCDAPMSSICQSRAGRKTPRR